MSLNLLSGVRHVVEEPSLFTDDVAARLEALRPQAGSGIGRTVLENVSLLSAEETNGFTVVQGCPAGSVNGHSILPHLLECAP